MFGVNKKAEKFFNDLCDNFYEKILRYLYYSLNDESAARDTAQDVFLTAYKKREFLITHPNPGGFLFQTAKNLAAKTRREYFAQLQREPFVYEEGLRERSDWDSDIETVLDRRIDETEYVEAVLSRLTDDKRRLYTLYYVDKKSMAEIAASLGLEEPALRMRFVRLRREIRRTAARIAEEYF